MNINLGCGDKKIDGAIGVDCRKTDAVDIRWNLSRKWWPFRKERFDNAYAMDIVEHMIDVFRFIDNVWRILKPKGMLYIRTTYFDSEQAYKDPTHFHFFTLESFDFCDPETLTGSQYNWYTKYKWKILSRSKEGEEAVFELQKIGGNNV